MRKAEQTCKPGSVKNDHLSTLAVTDRLKPPPENGRAGHMFSHGVAPDRVYSGRLSPTVGRALTSVFPPLPRHAETKFLRKPRSRDEAVYLCCTFPKVAFGGRYPLSLPCGARTFLVHSFSACVRGCPAYSPIYFTPKMIICQLCEYV